MADIENEVMNKPVRTKMAAPMSSPPPPLKAESKRRAAGGFGRLLGEVTNQIKVDCDEKVASKIQDTEASSLMNEWLQEVSDKQLAAALSEEEKRKAAEEKEAHDRRQDADSAAAARWAAEERRRAAREVQEKHAREEADALAAQHAFDEEKTYADACARDDALARELHDTEVAEAYQREEERRAAAARKHHEDLASLDERVAQAAQEALEHEERELAAKQEEEDQMVVRRLMEEEGSQRQQQMQQEAADAKLSHKMEVANYRAEHRRQKHLHMVVARSGAAALATPAEQWRDADPVIEDVLGGICISLLLPHVKDVAVRLTKKNVVVVEARRLVSKDEEAAAAGSWRKKTEHTTFEIDFEIDSTGAAVKIGQDDLHYEYASDCGLLHVYVENVHLEEDKGAAQKKVRGGVLRGVTSGFLSKLFSKPEAKAGAKETLM